MAGVVQGAALGAASELLFISLADATQQVSHFKSDSNRLESTLRLIKHAAYDIESLNKSLNEILKDQQRVTQSLADRLLEGHELIQKCSKVKWNVFKRLYYSKKLRKFEALLLTFFQINVAAFMYRESKKISVELSNVNEKLNELATVLNKSRIDGCVLAGNEQHFQGKKGMQLEDAATLEISSPRGHSAITVATNMNC